jgi:hypothetical protein
MTTDAKPPTSEDVLRDVLPSAAQLEETLVRAVSEALGVDEDATDARFARLERRVRKLEGGTTMKVLSTEERQRIQDLATRIEMKVGSTDGESGHNLLSDQLKLVAEGLSVVLRLVATR